MGTSELLQNKAIASTTATPNGLIERLVASVIQKQIKATLGNRSISPLAINDRELQ
jgi:hypothetical protein